MYRYRMRVSSRSPLAESARAGFCARTWNAEDAALELLAAVGAEVYQCCDGISLCEACRADELAAQRDRVYFFGNAAGRAGR